MAISNKLKRFFLLFYTKLYAFFTRRKIEITLIEIVDGEETSAGMPEATTVSFLWKIRTPFMRKKVQTMTVIPQAHRMWVISSAIQLGTQLVCFTYHLPDTALFIKLGPGDTIPVIVRESKLEGLEEDRD